MKSHNKNENAYKTIGEVAKELGLINKKNGQVQTHTIRFWETHFKQIKPRIRAGGRRYYSKEDFQLLRNIRFLLKERGLTINGVKKLLNEEKTSSIDVNPNFSVYNPDNNKTLLIKKKIKNISKIIKEIKKIKNG